MARKTRPTRDPRTGRFVSKKRRGRSRQNPQALKGALVQMDSDLERAVRFLEGHPEVVTSNPHMGKVYTSLRQARRSLDEVLYTLED